MSILERFKKPYLDVNDICDLMECCRNKGYDYLRAIKEVSDGAKTAGRVLVKDYLLWAYGPEALRLEIKEGGV